MNITKIVQEEKEKVIRNMINRFAYMKLDAHDIDITPEEITDIDIEKLKDEMVTKSNNEEELLLLREKKEQYEAFKELEKRYHNMDLAQLADRKLYKLLDEAGKEVKKYV